MAIRIVTDSTCDISAEDRKELDIHVVPLSVHFDDESYLDGVNITNQEFYEKLENSKNLPTTSQVSPGDFRDVFVRYLDAGDEVVGIFISGEISGTYQSAVIAKEMVGSDNVFIVDSRVASMGLALLVAEAVKYRDAGHTAAEITAHVKKLTKKVRFIAAINTLKYLRKGGRIKATTAVVGELMGIKPIVGMVNGSILLMDKAKGMSAAVKAMLKHVTADLPDLRYPVVFAHSEAPELLQKTMELFKDALKFKDRMVCNIGSVIGTYAGKGGIGFSYIAE